MAYIDIAVFVFLTLVTLGQVRDCRNFRFVSVNVLQDKDHYKFLGKLENAAQLDDEVFDQVNKEYLKRLSVIWSSNISMPRKIKATNTFALPVIQYHMWTVDWRLNDLRQLDRETRKVIQEHGGMHNSGSSKLLYLPTYQRGQGLIEIETIYKITKIKVSNYLMRSEDPRLQLVRRFEEMKVAKGLKSVLKDAANYAKGLGITITFDKAKTVLTNEDQKTIEVQQSSPKHISNFLTQAKNSIYMKETSEQKWLGAFTTAQSEDKEMATDVCKLLQKWRNIPDIVYSVNTNLRQQLLPTKTYEKTKLHQHVDDLKCRMCSQKQETVTHIMSACPKIAQSLYTSRHDKMLRPYYHYLLSAYGFNEESDHKRPWYQQRPPIPVIENSLAKVNWNIEFHMEKKPENNANKVDIAVMDKEKKVWLLIEGTVCGIGLISDKWKTKQDKYRELRTGIKQQYPDYKVNQVNVVFDFLAEYHQCLKNDLNEHLTGKNEEETQYLIMKSQKWIISQNVEIVKNFYTYKR
ncbi:uncharacterized protein [Montipora capricornis]|uniref:uncharacterized protein n=1 Tax=Montipora foliosa TaxID=591990 RepID=UPI0035F133A1